MVAHSSPLYPRTREPYPHGETVVHHRLVVVDDDDGYGQPVEEWVDAAWEGVGFAPGTSDEPLSGGSTRVVTQARIYDPMCRAVDSGDEFTVRGRRYAVDGDASGVWTNPITGWSPGSVVELKAVSGG